MKKIQLRLKIHFQKNKIYDLLQMTKSYFSYFVTKSAINYTFRNYTEIFFN